MDAKMPETRIVAVEPGQPVQVQAPALIENTSGLYALWVRCPGELPPPHRGHALQPGERLALPFAGVVLMEADSNVEAVVTGW